MDESVKLREDRQLLEQDREVAYHFSAESQPADDIPILEREDWPDPRLLKLDASQYEAMYRALTKEFSIIQVIMMVVVMLMMRFFQGIDDNDDDDDDDEWPDPRFLSF